MRPLSLQLERADQVLVLSGPNTGGKTVALKTLGLTVLMAQAGLPVPGTDVELPLYRQVRADVGDRQSIEADLSTFSAHIGTVVELLEAPAPPALFLFDEIGTGTEPAEGAALARSVLESLQAPGITAVATTHLGALKAWAFGGEGTTSAAMEFDGDTLLPTFRLLLGAPGTSAGLEIAERLGLSEAIVARARSLLGPESREGEGYIRRLRELVSELDEQRATLETERAAFDDERRRREDQLTRQAERQRRKASDELDRILESFGKQARRELARVAERKEQVRLERDYRRAERRLRVERSRYVQESRGPEDAADGWVQAPSGGLEAGARVHVVSLGKQGEVIEADGEKVDVQLGGLVLSVRPSDLRVPAEPRSRPSKQKTSSPPPKQPAGGPAASSPAVTRELRLIGMRVEQALGELDKFLDDCLVQGHEAVRIVHGHGSGRLRAAVRQFLVSHVSVDSHRAGDAAEGGDGATIVVLR